MTRKRYLTKSRYKLAVECPRKLYYTGKPKYPNHMLEDEFLRALAEGGFQVGALAKLYFPEGIDVDTLDVDEALARTAELLARENVVIFEAAIAFENCLVRVDVLKKEGNRVELIEVKSKSWSASESMLTRNGTSVLGKWKPYVEDVAFQHWVLTNAHPEWRVAPFLMLVDKDASAPSTGLNQRFKIVRDDTGRLRVEVNEAIDRTELEPPLLKQVGVEEAVKIVHGMAFPAPAGLDATYEDEIKRLAEAYEQDERLSTTIGNKCKNCEFYCDQDEKNDGDKVDGKVECWKEMTALGDDPFAEPTILDLYCGPKKQWFEGGPLRLADLTEEDIGGNLNRGDGKPGLSQAGRRQLQLVQAKSQAGDHFDSSEIRIEMETWKYPLHLIDFETSTDAIPFFKGTKPYDQIIFQISHHVLHEDGRVEHAGEFLDARPGSLPTIDAIRWLARELSADSGTIFRYHNHENTCLLRALTNLEAMEEPPEDAAELAQFVKSITHSKVSGRSWVGERNMVDLAELCHRFYQPVSSNGSTSLKIILPAIINGSGFLQGKYAQPIYGAPGGIPSNNFKDHTWVVEQNGIFLDPYSQLPPIFEDFDAEQLEELGESLEHTISEGGAAMVAYRRLQFTDVDDDTRKAIESALLKYCELDTLAMVMLVEGWKAMAEPGNTS